MPRPTIESNWKAIRAYIERISWSVLKWLGIKGKIDDPPERSFPPLPDELPWGKIEPEDLDPAHGECEFYFSDPRYKGAKVQGAGPLGSGCCYKGYSPMGVDPDPVTGVNRRVVCKKDK